MVWFIKIQPWFERAVLPKLGNLFLDKKPWKIAIASVLFDIIAMDIPLGIS